MDKIDLFNEIFEKTGLNPNRLTYLKNDLIERDGHLNGQLEKVRQWHKRMKSDPISCPEIGILTNSIIENEIQLRIIDDELSRLEREKAKGNPKGGNDQQSGENRVLAYNNNVKNAKKKIESILKDINTLIFENSTPDQWESVFNNQTPTIQIVVKPDVTFKDLRYFFDKLKDIGVFEVGYMKPLISLNAFYAKKSMCTLKHRQLIEGARSAKTAIPPLIDDINKLFDK